MVLYFGFVAQMVDSVTNPRSSTSSMLTINRAMSEGCSLLGLSGLADFGDDSPSPKLVRTSLGLTCMTRILCCLSSALQHSVMPCSANLLEQYAVPLANPRCPAVDEMFTMLPYLRPMKCFADSRATIIAPRTFVCHTLKKSSLVRSTRGPNLPNP